MSHITETITCPYCGYQAVENYCARCGQENHLHKETFRGMLLHFLGHYFHYDSKFWKTMKALWFSPGKLTNAYRQKQIMRYIPPISLYIFISAVFYLCSYLADSKGLLKYDHTHEAAVAQDHKELLQVDNVYYSDTNSKVAEYILDRADEHQVKNGNYMPLFIEKVNHNISKIFFCMIPVMAFILRMLFMRRKEWQFVDHAVFSIHYHSFWFSLFTFALVPINHTFKTVMMVAFFITALAYLCISMRNVYKTTWARSVAYTVTLTFTYSIALLLVAMIYLLIVVLGGGGH